MPPSRIVISSESEKSFSFAVKNRGEERDHGKHRTLCGVESRCFMQTALRRKTETANEKDPSTALGMTIRERAVSHSLSSRGGSEPPPLRTASFRGKEGVCRLLASSFRAKARNLFRLRSGKRCEEKGSRETPRSLRLGERRECAALPHLFPHLNTRTGWRPVRAVFLESSEWSSHKTIGL